MINLDTPVFRDEAEEARWWFEHNNELTENFEQAAANGTLRRTSESNPRRCAGAAEQH